MQPDTHDLVMEALKGTPAVAGAVASAMTLNEAVMISTGIYILLQAVYLIRKWWREEVDRAYENGRQHIINARADALWMESQQHTPEDRL